MDLPRMQIGQASEDGESYLIQERIPPVTLPTASIFIFILLFRLSSLTLSVRKTVLSWFSTSNPRDSSSSDTCTEKKEPEEKKVGLNILRLSDSMPYMFFVFSGWDDFPVPSIVMRTLADKELIEKIDVKCKQLISDHKKAEALPGAIRTLERNLLSFCTEEPLIKLQLVLSYFEKRELSLMAKDEDQAGLIFRYRFDQVG